MTEHLTSYAPNCRRGEHRCKITIMYEDYVGHIFTSIFGNCKGASILQYALKSIEDSCSFESDCSFECRESDGEEYYLHKLKNPAGDTLETDGDTLREVERMIVAVEIVSYEPEVQADA